MEEDFDSDEEYDLGPIELGAIAEMMEGIVEEGDEELSGEESEFGAPVAASGLISDAHSLSDDEA